jgi:hypothetical protein
MGGGGGGGLDPKTSPSFVLNHPPPPLSMTDFEELIERVFIFRKLLKSLSKYPLKNKNKQQMA